MANGIDTRRKNQNWIVTDSRETSTVSSWDQLILAVLMDIRDELQHLNRTFDCTNFQQIPWEIRKIVANTRKPKRKKPATLRKVA